MDHHIIDILEKKVNTSKADMCIIRWMQREQFQASVTDGVPRASSQVLLSGIGCRSLINGSWGFSSTTDIADIDTVISVSERLAQYNPGGVHVMKVPEYSWFNNEEVAYNIQEFFEIASDISKEIDNDKVRSCSVGLLAIVDKKVIVTTEGIQVYTVEPRILGNIMVVVKSLTGMSQYNEVVGGSFSVDILKEKLLQAVNTAVHTALCRANAAAPPKGSGPVLLKGDVVGLLTHEAVGHAVEADISQNRFLCDAKGEKVADSVISIVDNGTLEHGFGSITVDDEGVKSGKTIIIDKGVLNTFLHSRETAYTHNAALTGNARAWLYSREPAVRMTNTYIVPQDMSFEELLEEVRDGVYIQGSEGGNADKDGSFMVISSVAQKIEQGELIDEFYRGVVVSGNASKVLHGIHGVGNDTTFVLVPSMCGKAGSAFVGQGGPAVVCDLVVRGV
ncbi:MAG: TldD/PmbA family protein [Candidatus Methanofastidiosia archaeon]|jgi:TldD protein